MPTHYRNRKFEVAWKYQLPDEMHKVQIKVLNPKEGFQVRVDDMIVYGPREITNAWRTNQ